MDSRRDLLRTVSGVGVAVLAGCFGTGGGDEEGEWNGGSDRTNDRAGPLGEGDRTDPSDGETGTGASPAGAAGPGPGGTTTAPRRPSGEGTGMPAAVASTTNRDGRTATTTGATRQPTTAPFATLGASTAAKRCPAYNRGKLDGIDPVATNEVTVTDDAFEPLVVGSSSTRPSRTDRRSSFPHRPPAVGRPSR